MRGSEKRRADKARSSRVALGGVLAGLGVAVMYLGSFIEVLDLSVAVLASLFCIVAVIEINRKWALGIYVATAVLSVLLLPNKFPAAVYLMFAGFYPILKEILEGKIRSRVAVYAVKMLIFNVAFAAIIAASVFVLRLPVYEGWMLLALILLGNVVFVVYDIALTRLITVYLVTIRPRLTFLRK